MDTRIILRGLSWSTSENIINSGLTFIVGIVLARILSPQEFGTVGLLMVITAIGNTLADGGFSNSLIRSTKTDNRDYSTVFYFNIIFSVLFYLLVYALSPLIENFFLITNLSKLLRIISIVVLIDSIVIIPRTIFIRNLDFKSLAIFSSIGAVLGGLVSILMALNGYGIWSLIIHHLLKKLITSYLIWFNGKWKPDLIFSKTHFLTHFLFGYKLLISRIIDTLYKNMYQLVIGKFYSVYQLGIYTRADQFKGIFSSNLTAIIQKVSYPALSKIKDDDRLLKQVFKKFLKSTSLITFSLMLGLAAMSEPIITLILGEKWLEAGQFLKIICFSGMLYPLHALNLNMLLVKGRSDIFLKIEIIKKIYGVIPILLGIFLGIRVMLLSSIFFSILTLLIHMYLTSKISGYTFQEQVRDCKIYIIIGVVIFMIVDIMNLLVIKTIFKALLQAGTFFTLSFLSYELLKDRTYLKVRNLVLSKIKTMVYEKN